MALATWLMNGHYERGTALVGELLDDAAVAADIDSATLDGSLDAVLGCLDTADRWRELVALTPTLRRRLATEHRDPLFEKWGSTLTAAHLDLAAALDLVGEPDQAIELLMESQRAWRSNPAMAEILFASGSLLSATGERRRGLIYFEQIYEEYPHHPLADDALFAAAMALRDDGQTADARTLLERIGREHTTGEFPQRAQEILDQLDATPDTTGAAP